MAAIFISFSIFSLQIIAANSYNKPPSDQLLVNITLVPEAESKGAVCLDGSSPAYHLHRGFGSGAHSWLLQFEGGGWCNDVKSCLERASTHRGSSRYMNKLEVFSGILSNNASLNPDFYNWNRVKLRYCDGASFAGDSEFHNGTTKLYFRGQRIWNAIILDLLPKGLINATKALLSGCSAGGLASFLHCDNFTKFLPRNVSVKCLGDAGFFLDIKDISGIRSARSFYQSLVALQGVEQNLAKNCTTFEDFPAKCFFPQYTLAYTETPFFVLNSAYDIYQFHHSLVPTLADPREQWRGCKLDPEACSLNQLVILQDFRYEMLTALRFVEASDKRGLFINSCFAHCQSELQDTWFAPNSPRIRNKTISEAVGDWYFEREIVKEIGCPYPCDETCHNLIGNTSQPVAAPQKRLRFKTTVDASETQIIEAMTKIASHISNPAKFSKASKLAIQLIDAGSVKPGTSSIFFRILEAAMASPSACTDPSLRADYHTLFSRTHDVASCFSMQQKNQLTTWTIRAVVANDLYTDDSFIFSKAAGRVKEAISNLPVASRDDDMEEASDLAQDEHEIGDVEDKDQGNVLSTTSSKPNKKDDYDPFGLDALLPNASKDGKARGKKDAAAFVKKSEEEEYKRFLKSQREALILCLEIAARRYRIPWAQTVIDIVVKHAFDNIERFTSRQRDAIEKLWNSIREQMTRRKQGKSVTGKLDMNAFEWLQEKYAHEKISIRHSVGGGGDRRAQQWLG